MFQPKKHTKPKNEEPHIQPQLEVGEVDDEYEKEADSVADSVMMMADEGPPDMIMQDKKEELPEMVDEDEGPIQMMNDYAEPIVMMEEERDEEVQMMNDYADPIQPMSDGNMGGMAAPPAVEQGINNSKGSGQPLDSNIQKDIGGKMNTDLNGVNIHTDNNAVEMNKQLGSKAFTHGKDIYFNQGKYNPQSKEGKYLLAHELTHTVQQSGMVQPKIQRSAIAEKNKSDKTILIRANLNYYGEGANESFAQKATKSIEDQWNSAAGMVYFKERHRKKNKKGYKVIFRLTYKVLPANRYSLEEIQKMAFENPDPAENYILVVQQPNEKYDVSNMSNNRGTFIVEGADTAEYAHEFGHGLGFSHPKYHKITLVDESTGEEYKNARDYRGIDSIMIPGPNEEESTNIADPEYQKEADATLTDDPKDSDKVRVSSLGAALDPNKRKVSQQDINMLKLGELLADRNTVSLNSKQDYFWWGGDETPEAGGNITLPVGIPHIDPDTYDIILTKAFIKQTGKKDAQFVQVIYVEPDFSSRNAVEGMPMFNYKNARKGELIDYSKIPQMKGLYLPGYIRHEYVYVVKDDELELRNLIPSKPDSHTNGMPNEGAKWYNGFFEPEPLPEK